MELKFRLPPKGFKRLFYDIETSPNIGLFWSASWKANIPHDNIIKERAVICVCYKWEGQKTVHAIKWDENQCDKSLLEELMVVIEQADVGDLALFHEERDKRPVVEIAQRHERLSEKSAGFVSFPKRVVELGLRNHPFFDKDLAQPRPWMADFHVGGPLARLGRRTGILLLPALVFASTQHSRLPVYCLWLRPPTATKRVHAELYHGGVRASSISHL